MEICSGSLTLMRNKYIKKIKRLSLTRKTVFFLFVQICTNYEQIPASVRLQIIVAREKKPKHNAETPENASAK